jgi:hypothetical protein
MKTEHTPGPWLYRKTILETRAIDRKWEIVQPLPNGGGEMVVVGSNTGIDCLTEADARLIVACVNACGGINPDAVPDMLAALRNIQNAVEGLAAGLFEPGGPRHVNLADLDGLASTARAALAKAEGGEA